MPLSEKLIAGIARTLPSLELREREPMSAHTSFRIGGPARVMALPADRESLESLLALLDGAGVRPFIMGNGTNLLVSDAPLELFVIKTSAMAGLERRGDDLLAGAGISLARLAAFAADAGLTGLEFAHGIPGTLGGAVFMNAGAYGGEMKDVTVSTLCLRDGAAATLTGLEQGFSYRRSAFADNGGVIVESLLRLKRGDAREIKERMRELAEKRRASQPLDMPSAGSAFKRPEGGYAAALIDGAGLKGFAVGGAQVSEKHAGFIVNRGGATFDEVAELIEHIRETVYARSGVLLEPEVRILR